MSPSRAYFAGFGLHTTLGRGVPANLSALRLPIAPPQRATIQLSTREESAPYYLLAQEPLANPEDRLLNVLANVSTLR